MVGILAGIGIILIEQLLYMKYIRPSQGDGDIGLGALSVMGGIVGLMCLIVAVLLKIFL